MIRSTLLLLFVLCVSPTAEAQQARVLVVPFDVSPEAEEGATFWMGEAAALLVANGLQEKGYPVFTRAERAAAFEELELPTSVALTRATVLKVAQLIGATDVVVGTLTIDGDDAAVRARAVRVDAGRAQADIAERAPLRDLVALTGRIAERLADQGLGAPRAASMPHVPPPALPAFEAYVKGLVAVAPATREKFLRDAIGAAPEYWPASLALWEVLDEQERHDEALEVVQKVDPASVTGRRARFAAAMSLMSLDRHDEAFAALDALQKEAPSAVVLNAQGVIQLRRGAAPGTGSAVYYFNKAAELDPDDPDFLFNLGYAYAREGDRNGALYWLREAVRRAPGDGTAHLVMSSILAGSDRAVEAQRERELAELLGASAETAGLPGDLERLRTDLVSGMVGSAASLITNPSQREQQGLSSFHLDRGRRLFEQEQDREAAVELRRAIYLSPYLPEAHLLLGRLHQRAGRLTEAIEAFRIAIWAQETAAARLALAEALVENNQPDEARVEIARVLELEPESDLGAAARALLDRIK